MLDASEQNSMKATVRINHYDWPPSLLTSTMPLITARANTSIGLGAMNKQTIAMPINVKIINLRNITSPFLGAKKSPVVNEAFNGWVGYFLMVNAGLWYWMLPIESV